MIKLVILYSISLLYSLLINAQDVKIGDQVWMSKNLDVSTFRNGDTIAEVKSKEEWIIAGENKQPAWCYFQFTTNDSSKGKIYNWYAVYDPRGLAPIGYRIPTEKEWESVFDYYDAIQHVGRIDHKGKTRDLFYRPNNKKTTLNLSLPKGYSYYNGSFNIEVGKGFWIVDNPIQSKKVGEGDSTKGTGTGLNLHTMGKPRVTISPIPNWYNDDYQIMNIPLVPPSKRPSISLETRNDSDTLAIRLQNNERGTGINFNKNGLATKDSSLITQKNSSSISIKEQKIDYKKDTNNRISTTQYGLSIRCIKE